MSDAGIHIAAAQASRDAGDFYHAEVHQRRAIALLRGGDPSALGHAIRHLAEILVEGGQPDEAAAPVAEMLALFQTLPEVPPLERANALRCAALQVAGTGDDETARLFWAEARARYETLGIDAGVAEAEAQIAILRGG